MNDQIISQIKNLLSPAARAYLQKIVDGEVPLERPQGVSPLPEGLDATQVSMLHEIAQANEPSDLVIARIVNSGVLRTTGGGPTAPKSAEDLYNKLYDIVSGKTIGPAGPPNPAGQPSSSRVPGEGSAQGRDLTPPQPEQYATSRVPGGGRPTPASEQEVTGTIRRDLVVPNQLANLVLPFIDEEFRPWFILKTNEQKEILDNYPGTPIIPMEDRALLVEARDILDQLSEQTPDRPVGDERNRLIADVFANIAPFIQSGEQYGEVYESKIAGLERVLASARFVDFAEDPLGRDADGTQGPGFGRGPVTAGPPLPPAPGVPPTDRGTLTGRDTGTWFGLENLTPDQRRAVLEATAAAATAPAAQPARPAPSVPPTDRGTLGAQPASVGTVSAPSVPPTDRGTVPGVTQPALTPEQRYGTGGAGEGPPDRMGGPPTITPRMPAGSSTTTTTGGITPGGPAGAFDPAQQLAVPRDTVMGDAISPFVAAPGTGTGTTGTGGTTGDTTGGGGGGGVPTYVPEAPAVPEEWEQAASEIYGAYYSIIKQNPEVAALIAEASANKWGPEKFDYALEQTEWWRTTSLAIREFDIEMGRDPATVQARIDALAANLQQTALDLNIRLTNETLNRLATDATRQGWTEQQVTNALGTEAIKAGATGVTGLRYGFYGNKINEIAGNYGVSISDTEFNELVNKFAVGQENEQSLTSSFQTRATALFPAISERLMAGETFRNIVEPYRARASQILGRDFAATDFMDNDSFAQAVTYMGDDGKQRPMTYTEWGQYLRSNREFGYEFTDEAQSRAYQIANSIADIFGAI